MSLYVAAPIEKGLQTIRFYWVYNCMTKRMAAVGSVSAKKINKKNRKHEVYSMGVTRS